MREKLEVGKSLFNGNPRMFADQAAVLADDIILLSWAYEELAMNLTTKPEGERQSITNVAVAEVGRVFMDQIARCMRELSNASSGASRELSRLRFTEIRKQLADSKSAVASEEGDGFVKLPIEQAADYFKFVARRAKSNRKKAR